MAGRGTDIVLGAGVAGKGGLHVIALSSNESRRIDRQLYGRCARQGDPGSAEAILSLQDSALVEYYHPTILYLLSKLAIAQYSLPGFISKAILRRPQQVNEKRQYKIRKQLIEQDKQMQQVLAFSGKFE